MSATDELVAWLRACLDEDERITRTCIDYVGEHRAGELYSDGSGTADQDAFPSYPWGSESMELAFMAGPGHPASVIADIAAKRALLLLAHEGFTLGFHETAALGYEKAVADMVTILTYAYTGRPGWREEWSHG